MRLVRLCLKSYSDVLDGRRERGVSDAGNGAGCIVLSVAKARVGRMSLSVVGFKSSASLVKGTKLNRYLGNERVVRGA